MQRRRPVMFGNPQLGQPSASDYNAQQDQQQQAINMAAAQQYQQMRQGQMGIQPTQGAAPTLVPIDNNNASQYNAAQGQQQQNWNQYAANQYSQIHQQQLGNQSSIDLAKINTEQNRQLLAKAFGYSQGNSPSMGQLYTKFMSLPPDQQANIYKKGMAPWMDLGGEDQSGTDLVAAAAKVTNDHLNEYAGHAAQAIQDGKIIPHKNPDGTVSYTQIIDKPPIAPGMASTPTEVPAFDATVAYVNRAIQNGWTPDPTTGKMRESAAAPIQGSPMSTDQFQQILNARAQGGDDTNRFQQVLDQRARGIQPSTPMQQPSFSSVAPSQLANAQPQPSVDPFVAIHNVVTNPQTPQMLGDLGSQFGQFVGQMGTSLGSMLHNIPSQMSNAALRLIGGQGGGQYGQIPLYTPDSQQPAVDPQVSQQNAIIQALQAKQQQNQSPDLGDMQLMRP